ncbi:MAG: hypothetical protein QM750_07890 [Rubrivivax sp.]
MQRKASRSGWIWALLWLPLAVQAQLVMVHDSSIGGGRSGGTFFYLAEVDGVATEKNAAQASVSASRGRGSDLRVEQVSRLVSAGPRKLKLVGRMAYAMPIQALFKSAGNDPVEGVLQVDLVEGKAYRVNGVFDAFRREVWLEEAAGGARVGPPIVAPPDPAAAQAMAGADYTCCNLHYEGDWISDANYLSLPMIPAGARIKVREVSAKQAKVWIEGRPMRIGLDYGREQMTMQQMLDRLIVKEDPRSAIDGLPPAVQRAVRAGRLLRGMTRPQALLAVGPPRGDGASGVDAPQWRLETLDGDEFVLEWGTDGLLLEIRAKPDVLAQVEWRD